jgi:arsenate reductase
LGKAKKLHWSIPDPAHISGSANEITAAFDKAFLMLQTNLKNAFAPATPLAPAPKRN